VSHPLLLEIPKPKAFLRPSELRLLRAMVAKRFAYSAAYAAVNLQIPKEIVAAKLELLVNEGFLDEGEQVKSRRGEVFQTFALTPQGDHWADRLDELDESGLDPEAARVFSEMAGYIRRKFFQYTVNQAGADIGASGVTAGAAFKRLLKEGLIEQGDSAPSYGRIKSARNWRVTPEGRRFCREVPA
jgi:hypothetical protein